MARDMDPQAIDVAVWRREWAWFGFASAMGAPALPFVFGGVLNMVDGDPPVVWAWLCVQLVPGLLTASLGYALGGVFRRIDGQPSFVVRLLLRLVVAGLWGVAVVGVLMIPVFMVAAVAQDLETAVVALVLSTMGGVVAMNQVVWFGYAYRRAVQQGRRRRGLIYLAALFASVAGPLSVVVVGVLLQLLLVG